MHLFDHRHDLVVCLDFEYWRGVVLAVNIGQLKMHKVVWQGVPHGTVILRPTAQKHGTKPDLWKTPDDLIHPTGNPPGHKRKGAFQQ